MTSQRIFNMNNIAKDINSLLSPDPVSGINSVQEWNRCWAAIYVKYVHRLHGVPLFSVPLCTYSAYYVYWPIWTARTIVLQYNCTQYCSTVTVFLILPFLQTNIISQMWPSGGRGRGTSSHSPTLSEQWRQNKIHYKALHIQPHWQKTQWFTETHHWCLWFTQTHHWCFQSRLLRRRRTSGLCRRQWKSLPLLATWPATNILSTTIIMLYTLGMYGIYFLFRFYFGSVFEKTRIWFEMSLVRFGSKNAVRFGYYSYLLLM